LLHRIRGRERERFDRDAQSLEEVCGCELGIAVADGNA
jgi:hypothetical protein